ncbi:MAG: glucuronate isomerase [Oscillospiraceae bacterium]|nr:glucuronate isomerase [Oscillospiraceae bacterium]
MNHFLSEDFYLGGETGGCIYKEYAEKLPVIDYHNHLNPEDIAKDRRYDNMTELWLEGDHYKWRLMRWAGVHEEYITGDAAPYEKFKKWAAVLQKAIGNPLYIWSHLELKRYFGYDGLLNPDTAERVYKLCNERLGEPEMSARGLILQSKVEYLCTTDDPADSLEWHEKTAASGFSAGIAPTFRPDRVLNIEAGDYAGYIERLSSVSGVNIKDLDGLKAALINRMDYFEERGCRISDHGIEYSYSQIASEENAAQSFNKIMNNLPLEGFGGYYFKSVLMRFLAAEYSKRGWVMQLHYGCWRNANRQAAKRLGANTGFDCMNNTTPVTPLINFLNYLAAKNCLPKTILYSLNPNDDRILASAAGAFQEGGIVGKVQHGSAWWFNDHADGIRAQLRSLASIGYLPAFIGMLTDGRSFLSFSRHEYFRRILCGLLGDWVDKGEFPRDIEALGEIASAVSYYNAKGYFIRQAPSLQE